LTEVCALLGGILVKDSWVLRSYLDGTEGVILAGANAFGDGGETARNALEREQKRDLVLSQHVTVHVAVTGRQQIHLLHRVHFQLVKPRLRPLYLRLHLASATCSFNCNKRENKTMMMTTMDKIFSPKRIEDTINILQSQAT